ncbi:MAG: ATP-dependent DNA helicase [Candidatus Peribacteraceae bacterium]
MPVSSSKARIKSGEGDKDLSMFESEYAKLNPEQRKAVDTIEGPVMVVAGPGTGKTQTVAMRVANILRKTHARPGNILCLTFSVSGATAMRERLRLLIGPDAYGVTVSTIHKFCADIIAAHPALFDDWSARRQISDIEQLREMNKIIDQNLPDLALVNLKGPHARTKDILGRISQVKKEGKTIEDLRRVAQEYEQIMAGKSKPETKQHQKNLLAARKFKEFTTLFEAYREMQETSGRFDYDDMILFANAALEREDWLLAGLQERYQYILVDEFQDTNGSQYRLIELLTRPVSPEDKPNLFVVGDDDQAIYRFQGANLQNILRFHERFPKAAVIALTRSYRATQAILDAAGRLIAHNTERLVGKIPGLKKELVSASGEAGIPPVLLRPPSDAAEPWMIADIVHERLKTGTKPAEIAVIVQTNKELRPLYDVLAGRNIPVRLTGKNDLLAHPYVLQALAILRVVENINSSGVLADAISAECFDLHPADLGQVFLLRREAKCSLMDLLRSLDQPSSPAGAIHFRDLPRMLAVRDLLEDLSAKAGTRTVPDTLERIYKECGLIAQGKDIHPLDLVALQAFFDRAHDRTAEHPNLSLRHFLEEIDFYANPENGLRMSYDFPHLVSEGVQLLTAHQSKGLEFQTVILANFREGLWDAHKNPGGVSVPEDLLFGWEKETKSFEKNQDERRVAFVAMTRAKRELILSCPKELTAGDKTKSVSPSAFAAEAGPLPEEERGISDPEHASVLLLHPKKDFDADMREFLLERIKNFSLSASALNHFIRDPQMFLEADLLRVPEAPKGVFTYGHAVHQALRHWALKKQEGTHIDQKEFLAEFMKYMEEREVLSDQERTLFSHLGLQTLPRYFDERLSISNSHIDSVERAFTARLGEVPIKGTIDRIDRDSPEAASGTVIDYKTETQKSEAKIREEGYLFRQLQFYAVLLEEAYPSLTPNAFVLDFIGDREEGPLERVFRITPEEKQLMRQLIANVWAKITALDFTPLESAS